MFGVLCFLDYVIWMVTKNSKKIGRFSSKSWSTTDVVEKNLSNPSESNVSVITKTTNPKVIIQSEGLHNNSVDNPSDQYPWKNQILKFVCMVIMCMVILATFFLSLRIYNILNELALLQ